MRRDGRGDEWAIRLARWSQVRLGGLNEARVEEQGSPLDLVVRVGRRTFVALFEGPGARRALRDFVVTVQQGMRGEFAYHDDGAASMLTF
jgi:hypothetical protein